MAMLYFPQLKQIIWKMAKLGPADPFLRKDIKNSISGISKQIHY